MFIYFHGSQLCMNYFTSIDLGTVCLQYSPCPSLRSLTSHASITSPYQSQGASGWRKVCGMFFPRCLADFCGGFRWPVAVFFKLLRILADFGHAEVLDIERSTVQGNTMQSMLSLVCHLLWGPKVGRSSQRMIPQYCVSELPVWAPPRALQGFYLGHGNCNTSRVQDSPADFKLAASNLLETQWHGMCVQNFDWLGLTCYLMCISLGHC